MDILLSLLSDFIILAFNLSLYMKLTTLKKDTRPYRLLMYGGTFLVMAAYFVAAYLLHIPYAAASFICMTVPSFLMFFALSKYKNARFLVTFCFVDTVTYIIAFYGKVALVLGGTAGAAVSTLVLFILCVAVFLGLRPYFPRYRNLMAQVAKGWGAMGISTVFIYILLVFSAAYPAPIITRLDYLPVYSFLCITILSFYAVFIVLLMQKAKLMRMNQLLQQQQHWHKMAYVDDLTQLANPAAYAARTEALEKRTPHASSYALLLFDVDNFKTINDTQGHHVGNQVLKKTADYFLSAFPAPRYEVFRIGGDEFAVIAENVPEKELSEQVDRFNTMALCPELGCTYSCGCAAVDFDRKDAFQQAFIQADQAMYAAKSAKKISR